MYTIKSVSEEGEYYLVNHWNKHKMFWQKKEDITLDGVFINARDAKTSLTKLLKIMPEYKKDEFSMVWVFSLVSNGHTTKETKDLYMI